MQSIDVVLLTKNSERVLEKCLCSIFDNVVVNNLIVVDCCSTDATLKILETFSNKYKNIVILKDKGTRGSARMMGIRNVKTEWFMFVDSDVTLCKGWLNKAHEHVTKDVGAVWGIELWDGIQNSFFLKLFLQITKRIFEIRGGTHDLLVRHKAVEDIDIPENLHVFEDTYIKEWVSKKGYKLIAAYDPYCIHFRPPVVWTFKGSLDIILDSLRFGSFSKICKLSAAYGFYSAYVIYRNILQKKLN